MGKVEVEGVILADGGFDTADNHSVHFAYFKMASFLKAKQQLGMQEVESLKTL